MMRRNGFLSGFLPFCTLVVGTILGGASAFSTRAVGATTADVWEVADQSQWDVSCRLELMGDQIARRAAGVAARFLGRRPMGNRLLDPEDVAQEVLLKLFRAQDQFDPSRPFSPWFYRITKNVIIDLFRSRSMNQSMVSLDDESAIVGLSLFAEGDSLLDEWEKVDEIQAVFLAAAASLQSPLRRFSFFLYYQGMNSNRLSDFSFLLKKGGTDGFRHHRWRSIEQVRKTIEKNADLSPFESQADQLREEYLPLMEAVLARFYSEGSGVDRSYATSYILSIQPGHSGWRKSKGARAFRATLRSDLGWSADRLKAAEELFFH